MKKPWRPDNWEFIRPFMRVTYGTFGSVKADKAYCKGYKVGLEAGADAIMTALKKEPQNPAGNPASPPSPDQNGTTVFIPN